MVRHKKRVLITTIILSMGISLPAFSGKGSMGVIGRSSSPPRKSIITPHLPHRLPGDIPHALPSRETHRPRPAVLKEERHKEQWSVVRETETLKEKIDYAIKIVSARAKEEMRGNMSQEGNRGGDVYAEWLREVIAKLRHISLNLGKGMSQGEKGNFGSCSEELKNSRKELKDLQDTSSTYLIPNVEKAANDSVMATIKNIR